jgi:hypothetical protein
LWTYPNLFKKRSKELADLMVVFGKDVIIFSDKACSYPNSGDPHLGWKRWYKKSVLESAHQISQAERWIRSYPDKIFLDSQCTTTLPIRLPPPEHMRVHRICVTLGALDRAEAETGGRGLNVDTMISDAAVPFTIGKIDSTLGWTHVFDEASLPIILQQLSTTADFVEYLTNKVAFLSEDTSVNAESELDLLAYYLWNGRRFPRAGGAYRFGPNLWKEVEASPAFLTAREENKISRFWDGLIEYITTHYLSETLEFGNELQMSEYERIVRVMAGETRFFRRILAKAILDRAEIARENAISTLLPSGQPDVSYVLFIGRGDQGGNHDLYRADRASQLKARCIAAKAVKPERRYIIGIALDARGVRGSSEDFAFIDTGNWSGEAIHKAAQLREEFGYFIPGQATERHLSEDEYPQG